MIRDLCYELYKIDWKEDHMITFEIEKDSIKNFYCNFYFDNKSSFYTYDMYLNDYGYDGLLYACYDEFFETEYFDSDYMCHLLDNEKLIQMYLEDIRVCRHLEATAKSIMNSLKICGFNDITDSSGYYIIREFDDGSERSVDVYKSNEGGVEQYIIYCSYEDENSDWIETRDMSKRSLMMKLDEIYNN